MASIWSDEIFLKNWKIGVDYRVDFSDVEIDVFFGMSDVNGDGTISTDVSLLMLRIISQFASFHQSLTGHYTILHIKWIQESNDMIDAIDEASSDEEFDEDDLTNGATG